MMYELTGLILVLVLFIPRMVLFWILAKKPKPLNDLICVITGGAGEIGQVVSIIYDYLYSKTLIYCTPINC